MEGSFLQKVGPCHLVGPVVDVEQVGNLNSVTSPADPSPFLPVPEVSNLPKAESSGHRGDGQSSSLT